MKNIYGSWFKLLFPVKIDGSRTLFCFVSNLKEKSTTNDVFYVNKMALMSPIMS